MRYTSAAEAAPYASSSLLARNTVLNLAGQGAPLVVAVVALPVLIDGLGTDRFGMLTIAWVFLSYFSLFDLGMSRALTQLLSEALAAGRDREAAPLVWTALLLTLGLGLAGAALTALLARPVVYDVLTIADPAVRADSLRAFYVLAASVPVVILTAALRGVLEARQRFDVVNAIRIPLGVSTFAAPLVVLAFSARLLDIVLVLVGVRLVALLAHLHYGLQALPAGQRRPTFDARRVRRLLQFGGWMTVSNVVSPLMVYMDRFLIGAVLSVTAVAYYATPWEVVTKLLLVPTAVAGVLFPAFSYWYRRDPQQAARLYFTGLKGVLLVLFPLVLVAVVFARPGLAWWLDPAFADESYRPMQLLAVGVLLNGVAAIPFALLQGLGRPDLTARLHLAELVVYAAVLWGLLPVYGIVGAAMAWLLRVGLDLGLLCYFSGRALPEAPRRHRRLLAGLGGALSLLALALVPAPLGVQLAGTGLVLPAYAAVAWRHALTSDERRFVRERLRRRSPSTSQLPSP